jgi:inosine-uridine nucleoside N-ribohydrolase
MRGKGGLDELKPFCFLHDPLAVWLALGGGGKDGCPNHLLWSKRYVSVDTGYGSSRGSLLHHREKAEKDNPSREPMMGTEVEWITAGAFDNHRDAFVNAIKDLLAIAR